MGCAAKYKRSKIYSNKRGGKTKKDDKKESWSYLPLGHTALTDVCKGTACAGGTDFR